MWEVKPIVEANGNGSSENPKIEKIFEPLDDDTPRVRETWVELEEETGDRRITSSDEVHDKLGIEQDEESESN